MKTQWQNNLNLNEDCHCVTE